MNIKENIKKMRENSKKRNFVQTVDLFINLGNINLSKPENRFSADILLPYAKGKKTKICIISSSKIKEADSITIQDLEKLKKDRKKAKKIAEKYDYFLAEAPLMPKIGKILGSILAPRGKMPKPFAPGSDITHLLEKSNRTLKINVRESPTIHLPVGDEKMKDEKIEENIKTVLGALEKNLPKGRKQIKSVFLKLTMGPSLRLI